jgi:hypothetical protein
MPCFPCEYANLNERIPESAGLLDNLMRDARHGEFDAVPVWACIRIEKQ